jgi:pimeloyl-ACP methyl ester carboxylesterase
VGRTHYPWLPVGTLLRHRFDSAALAPRLRVPSLFVYGAADDIIPAERSESLAAAWGGPVERLRIEGHGHNDLDFDPRYAPAIEAFVGRHL